MSAEPFLLVVNPRAGAGRAETLSPRLVAALRSSGANFDVARTEGPQDATRLVRDALRRGCRGIAVVGGDGTLSEAANGFFDVDGAPLGTDAWLGPVSCGTGGDFRKTLGTLNVARSGRGLEAAVKSLLDGVPRRVDVGWLEHLDHDGAPAQRAFLNIASFGVAGRVDQLVNAAPKWMGGTPAFLLGTLRGLAGFEPQRVRVSLDDGPARSCTIVNMAVANGRFFGGGMMIAPEAALDDGQFDVVGIERSIAASLALTPRVYAGTHLHRPGVSFERARVVHAVPESRGERVLLDVDGEAPGILPATFRIRPGAFLLRG